MRTLVSLSAAAFLVAAVTAIATTESPTPTVRPEAKIEVWWGESIERGVRCIYMRNLETNKVRRICPVEGGGCWDDTGWQSAQPTGGDRLPTYYDAEGNLYISVELDEGGTFASGTCLTFSGNSTGVIMMPAGLVE